MAFIEQASNLGKRTLQTGVAVVSLLSSFTPAAEWNGGSDWALFDVAERRAMWVWNMGADNAKTNNWDGVASWKRGLENYKGSRDLFLDFCQNKSIRSIYVFNAIWEWDQATLETGHIPNEAAWVDLMADATSRGIQVWMMGYLWDDPNDSRMTVAANKQALVKIMQAIAAFNRAHPTTPIAGFHNDQEPGTTSVYDDLLDTMKNAQDWVDANAPSLKISQALRPINSWRGTNMTWNGQTKTMNQHIIGLIGHTAYMAYSDTPSTVLNTYAKPACDYGATVGRKVGVGLEVTDLTGLWPGSEAETWYEQIQAEPVATRFKTDPLAPVTFEDCLHDTASALSANAGYDRIVLHESASYFGHWFGQYPRDYILAQSGGTYVSANPSKVNLLTDTKPLVGMGPGNIFVDVVATDASASETGPNSGTFTFTRYGSTSSPLTVHYTLGGTAVSGTDFTSIGTSVVIPAGQSTVTVTLTPAVDATPETAETVILTLGANAAYSIGLSAATVHIATDYGIPTWIVAGQSNAEGYAITSNPVSGLAPASTLSSIGRNDLNVTHSNVRFYQGNTDGTAPATSAGLTMAPRDSWHTMLPYEGLAYDWGTGIGNESGRRFGPELAFGYDVQRRLGGQIAIIKYARSSASLASSATVQNSVYLDYDPSDSRANHYDKLVTTITNAVSSLPAGDVLRIKGIVWMQGEGDANASMAPNYQANLTELITALRNQLSTIAASSGGKLVPDTTWGNVKVHVGTIAVPGTNGDTVRAAQAAVAAADPNVLTVNGATDITMMTNDDWAASGLHYDTAGQVTLGERFANSAVPAYAITYSGNGHTGGTVPAGQTKIHGINLTLATNSGSLVRTGYTFAGWNTSPDGSGVAYAAGATYITEAPATLYADWVSSTPGFNIGSISGPTTEAGGASTFTVRLNTQPTANVTISLATSDATEGAVSPSSLTFTTANWNLAQTVTVTGLDDVVIDGNIAYSIVTGSATSSDSNYNGLNPADVPVINNDNDVPGFVVSAISGPTTEAGGVAIFTVRLSGPPTANVTIGLTSSDATEGAVSPSSLTFTTSNWSTNQTVTVTGVDDALADADIAYSIVTAAATSADSNYNGLNPADVTVTNINDDYTMTHWWKLDGNANDFAGTLHGAHTGTPSWVTGISGQAMQSNASHSTTFGLDGTVMVGTSDYTISLWIKSPDVSAERSIWSKHDGNWDTGYPMVALSLTANGGLNLWGRKDVNWNYGQILSTATGLDNNAWHHVVVTRTSGVTRLYVNGVLDKADTGNQFNYAVNAAYTFRLAEASYAGMHDDVRMYNSALSASAIQNLHQQFQTYTVTYNGNGNTGGTAPADPGSPYPHGSSVTVLGNTGNLVKSGYAFANWNTAANGSGATYAPGSTLNISSNCILYAQWTVTPYSSWSSTSFANIFSDTALTSNPDGDSLNNLQEFAFGMDPTSAATGSLAYTVNGNVTRTGTPIIENLAGAGQPAEFHAVFLRRKNHAAAGLTYTVWFSPDLSQWTASAAIPSLRTGAGSSGDMEAVEVPFPAGAKFFRVAVTGN